MKRSTLAIDKAKFRRQEMHRRKMNKPKSIMDPLFYEPRPSVAERDRIQARLTQLYAENPALKEVKKGTRFGNGTDVPRDVDMSVSYYGPGS